LLFKKDSRLEELIQHQFKGQVSSKTGFGKKTKKKNKKEKEISINFLGIVHFTANLNILFKLC